MCLGPGTTLPKSPFSMANPFPLPLLLWNRPKPCFFPRELFLALLEQHPSLTHQHVERGLPAISGDFSQLVDNLSFEGSARATGGLCAEAE